jgi:hypothetical protein
MGVVHRHTRLLGLSLLLAGCGHTQTPEPAAPAPVVQAPTPEPEPAPEPEVVLTVPESGDVEAAPELVLGTMASGGACLQGSDCSSGVCEGEGCGDDAPGVCAPAQRSCTRDRRPYCGCDGETFFSSGSCPGARFSQRGMCSAP